MCIPILPCSLLRNLEPDLYQDSPDKPKPFDATSSEDEGGDQDAEDPDPDDDPEDKEEGRSKRLRKRKGSHVVPRRTKHELFAYENHLTVYRHDLGTPVALVACGAEHTLVALQGRGLMGWGNNANGQVSSMGARVCMMFVCVCVCVCGCLCVDVSLCVCVWMGVDVNGCERRVIRVIHRITVSKS